MWFLRKGEISQTQDRPQVPSEGGQVQRAAPPHRIVQNSNNLRVMWVQAPFFLGAVGVGSLAPGAKQIATSHSKAENDCFGSDEKSLDLPCDVG